MLSSRKRLDAVVNGYIQCLIYDQEEHKYEGMLSSMIIEYLRMPEYFEFYDKGLMNCNDSKSQISRTSFNGDIPTFTPMATAYGSIQIPSKSETIHHWKFMVVRNSRYVGIGIDEATHKRLECGLQTDTGSKQYALWSDGDKSCHLQSELEQSGLNGYEVGQIVEMTLNLTDGQISYRFNKGDDNILFSEVTIGTDIVYSMAVCIVEKNDCVELIDYYCE